MYGMDFPSREELIANHFENEQEVAASLGADSLRYLSVEGLMDAVPQGPGTGYCDACFTGCYPVPVDLDASKTVIED